MSLIKVIRSKCLDCTCDQPLEVRLCPVTKCPLHPYRMGKDPFRKKKTISQEQVEKMQAGRRK